MAHTGIGYFDSRGHFFKAPEEATISDLAALLGRIGDGDSLAPGIAAKLLERRDELNRIFAEHDALKAEQAAGEAERLRRAGNVTQLPAKSATG